MLAWYLCDFQGIRTSIAKEPYIFVIFQGGPDPLPSPLLIRTCIRTKQYAPFTHHTSVPHASLVGWRALTHLSVRDRQTAQTRGSGSPLHVLLTESSIRI